MILSRTLAVLALSLAAGLPLAASTRAADNPAASEWEEISHDGDLTMYARTREGSSIRELRAVGTIDAPNWVVKNVLDDGDHYAEFMPNVLESHVLSRDPVHHTAIAYARLSAPLISSRDYALLIHDESQAAADGSIVYKSRWEPAGDKGPPEKPGFVRIKVNEGSWVLESSDHGKKTRATYQLYSDGGGLPAFVLNTVGKRRIGEEFAAIDKRAQAPQYRKAKPAYP